MKILSQIDVITNSSTEVFILDTTKTPEEVKKELSEFTTGFLDPEIIEKGGGFWEDFKDWWFYFDPDDEESLMTFYWSCVSDRHNNLRIDYSNTKELNTILDFRNAWVKFICEKFKKYLVGDDAWWFVSDLENGDIPYKILENKEDSWKYKMDTLREFIDTKKPILPKLRNTHFDMNNIVGKIYVMGEDDNSIPFDDWDRINSDYNGENFHLG